MKSLLEKSAFEFYTLAEGNFAGTRVVAIGTDKGGGGDNGNLLAIEDAALHIRAEYGYCANG